MVLNRDLGRGLEIFNSLFDPSLFLHHSFAGIIVLLVYMDDIIITGTNMAMIKDLQSSLHQSFHIKDLGPLTS